MERVNHVDVVEVGSGGFVGNVDRVLEWQVSYGEGLKFGISGSNAAFILII